jgi:hypothetical protein
VLCPSRQLTPAVGGHPAEPAELARLAQLRPWQRALLEDVLWAAYERGLAGEPATDGERA